MNQVKLEAIQILLKVVETSCKALGYTPEAVKYVSNYFYSLNGHLRLNSGFLTVTQGNLGCLIIWLKNLSQKWVCRIILYFAETCSPLI